MEDHSLQCWNRIPPDDPDETILQGGRQLMLPRAGRAHRSSALLRMRRRRGRGSCSPRSAIMRRRRSSRQGRRAGSRPRPIWGRLRAPGAAAGLCGGTRRRSGRPELLDGAEGEWLDQWVAEDISSFHQVVYQALMMAGTGPVRQALDGLAVLALVRTSMIDFVRAQAVTVLGGDGDGPWARVMILRPTPTYVDTIEHSRRLSGEGDDPDVLLGVLSLVGHSAGLTETEINSHRDAAGYLLPGRSWASRRRPERGIVRRHHVLGILPDDDSIIGLNAP